MRLLVIFLALSTFAAAGPLPPFSEAALETRASSSTLVNNTLGSDPVAALTKLKATYDSLNEPEASSTLKIKRDFWTWLKDAFEAPDLKARSSESIPTSANITLDFNTVAVLNELQTIYNSVNELKPNSTLIIKRDFWKWLKDAFEAPGLKPRSSDSNSTQSDEATGSDPVVTLTKLKGVYASLNEKRMESDPKAKRGFWTWLKDIYGSPPNVDIAP
ncbi:MAG: hypothetical protein Q9175_004801 [Cornicularia normoerica]